MKALVLLLALATAAEEAPPKMPDYGGQMEYDPEEGEVYEDMEPRQPKLPSSPSQLPSGNPI